jgi:hypothetical protein
VGNLLGFPSALSPLRAFAINSESFFLTFIPHLTIRANPSSIIRVDSQVRASFLSCDSCVLWAQPSEFKVQEFDVQPSTFATPAPRPSICDASPIASLFPPVSLKSVVPLACVGQS